MHCLLFFVRVLLLVFLISGAMVRFDTYNASAHLVRQIESSHVATVEHDGGDNLLIRLHTGEKISVYLIETIIPAYEIRMTLSENSQAGIHTLFILWGAMFLPENGEIFEPDDWMIALLSLYDKKIYAFDVYGKDIRIFPVYFEPVGYKYRIRYEPDIDVTRLGCDVVKVHYHDEIRGEWRIADFAHNRPQRPPAKGPKTAWEILGISPQADLETVKRTYRQLARLYHPDINPSPDATYRMQSINHAYAAILRTFERGTDVV